MGEVAEMMLDGTLCQQCGEYIGDAVGYPRTCVDCEAGQQWKAHADVTKPVSKRAQKRAAQAARRAERNRP